MEKKCNFASRIDYVRHDKKDLHIQVKPSASSYIDDIYKFGSSVGLCIVGNQQ